MRGLKAVFTAMVILVLTMLALACAPRATPAPPAAELPVVEMGLPREGVFGLVGQYIIDKGIDRKHGLVLKPRWAQVPEIERLLAIGAISVGLAVSESAVRANIKGIPLRLLQPIITPHQQVLVRKDSPYQSIEDLLGKPLALTPEVTALYNMFDFIMRSRGFDIEKDFELKKMGVPAIIAALEKGDVEAGIIWEAHVSRLLATGRYRVIMRLGDELERILKAPKLMAWVAALEPWVQQNPELVRKLRAVWREGAGGAREDEAHFRRYAKEFFGLEKPEEVKLGWERTHQFIGAFKWPDTILLKQEKTYLTKATEMGIFPKEALPVIEQLFVD